MAWWESSRQEKAPDTTEQKALPFVVMHSLQRNTLIFFFLLCSMVINAQQIYFNERYEFNGNWDGATSVLEADSGYIVLGTTNDSLGMGFSRLTLQFIDTVGNVIIKKSYGRAWQAYYSGIASLVKTSDSGYACVGTVYDTVASDAFLMKFNGDLDSLWTKTFGGAGEQLGDQCKTTNDNGFIIVGSTYIGNTQVWLIKTDSLGNLQWQQTYGGGGADYGRNIDLCYDAGYIIGGQTKSFGQGEYDTYVIKIDSLGNFQWQKTFGGVYNDGQANVKQTADGGYIVGCVVTEYLTPPSYHQSKARMIKLDSGGNTVWDNTYGPERPSNVFAIHELPDGSFVAAGQRANWDAIPFGSGYANGLVFKVNSQGDSIWYRIHENIVLDKASNYLRDIIPTTDKGFIAVGFLSPGVNGSGTQDTWVLKLDSLGCAFAGCDTLTRVVELGVGSLELSVKVYPNPARERFTIEGNYELPAVLELYDMMGRKVREFEVRSLKFEVDVQGWKGGIYLYRLTGSDGRVVSGKLIIE